MSESIVAKKGPYAVEVEAGRTYYWCACGRAQPAFCDGSHKVTSITPVKFTPRRAEESISVAARKQEIRPIAMAHIIKSENSPCR